MTFIWGVTNSVSRVIVDICYPALSFRFITNPVSIVVVNTIIGVVVVCAVVVVVRAVIVVIGAILIVILTIVEVIWRVVPTCYLSMRINTYSCRKGYCDIY